MKLAHAPILRIVPLLLDDQNHYNAGGDAENSQENMHHISRRGVYTDSVYSVCMFSGDEDERDVGPILIFQWLQDNATVFLQR